MWVWIVIGIIVVGGLAAALWPRRSGVVDGDVSRARRSMEGELEKTDPSIRRDFPMGGGF
jgi:hypothetical protein